MQLRKHHVDLAENLNLTELLDHLLAKEVVTMLDVETIRAEKGPFKQNCCLLYILQTKPCSQVELFIECLIETNQLHLARKIDPNGNKHSASSLVNFSINCYEFKFTCFPYLQ